MKKKLIKDMKRIFSYSAKLCSIIGKPKFDICHLAQVKGNLNGNIIIHYKNQNL